MSEEKELWRDYFNVIEILYKISQDPNKCLKLWSTDTIDKHAFVPVADLNSAFNSSKDRINRQYRGVFQMLDQKTHNLVAKLIDNADNLLDRLKEGGRRPAYCPRIEGDGVMQITLKNKPAFSSKQFKTGVVSLMLRENDTANVLNPSIEEHIANKIVNLELVRLPFLGTNVAVHISVDEFIKFYRCTAMRVRKTTCERYYGAFYKNMKTAPVHKSIGISFIPFNAAGQTPTILMPVSRKQRERVYCENNAKISINKIQTHVFAV